jgi:hypothetical protein
MLHEGKFNPGIPQVHFPMLSLFSSALYEFELFFSSALHEFELFLTHSSG